MSELKIGKILDFELAILLKKCNPSLAIFKNFPILEKSSLKKHL